MSNKIILKDRITGEEQYPITYSDCIITKDNSNVATESVVDYKIADTLESSPSIVTAITDLKNKLQDEEDVAVAVEEQISDASIKVFNDLWLKACGTCGAVDWENHPEAPYYLNELWLTYDEAIVVYTAGNRLALVYTFDSTNLLKSKTNLPPIDLDRYHSTSSTYTGMSWKFFNNPSIEIIRVCDDKQKLCLGGSAYAAFAACRNLKKILGIMDISNVTDNNLFNGAQNFGNLTTFYLVGLKSDIDLHRCTAISAETLQYMMTNRTGTNTITITLSAGRYNKVINGEDEFEGLLDLASSKNILIASA